MEYDYKCWFDGACGPDNPGGHIGMGSLIKHSSGLTVLNMSTYRAPHENNTNNVAEYGSLYFVLKHFSDNDLCDSKIIIHGDSKLVIMQMSGAWKIKESEAKYLNVARACRELLKNFKNITFKWVPREQNYECDRLSKRALESMGHRLVR